MASNIPEDMEIDSCDDQLEIRADCQLITSVTGVPPMKSPPAKVPEVPEETRQQLLREWRCRERFRRFRGTVLDPAAGWKSQELPARYLKDPHRLMELRRMERPW